MSYVKGSKVLEDQTVGAVDANSHNGHADVEADNGGDREVTEMISRTDRGPWKMMESSDVTSTITRIGTTRHAPKFPHTLPRTPRSDVQHDVVFPEFSESMYCGVTGAF